MKLYCINKKEDLVGKPIKDTCLIGFRGFKDYQALLTEDGGIYATKFYPKSDPDDEDYVISLEINEVNQWEMERVLAQDSQLRRFIHAMGATYKEIDEFAIKEVEKRKLKEKEESEKRKKEKYEEAKRFILEYEKESH